MRRIVILITGFAALPALLWAQGISFGVKGGVNVSELTGRDVSGSDVRLAALGGVFAAIGRGPGLSLQLEALYSMKGDNESEELGGGQLNTTTKLDYIEFPLLCKFSLGKGPVASIYAGPAVALLTGATVEGNLGTLSATFDAKEYFKRHDTGLACGLELRTEKTSLEVRYTASVATVGKAVIIDGIRYAAPDLRNATVSVMLGYYIF